MPPELIMWTAWVMLLVLVAFVASLWWSLHRMARDLERTVETLVQMRETRRKRPRIDKFEEERGKAIDILREVIIDNIAQGKVELWGRSQPSLDSALHSLDIRRNLLEIEKLEKNIIRDWFNTSPITLSAQEVGRLLANYMEEEDGEFNAFKLGEGVAANVCGFDSAFRIISGIEFKRDIVLPSGKTMPLAPIAEKALDFVIKGKQNGFYADRPGTDGRASVFSTCAAYELVRNLKAEVPNLDFTAFDESIEATIETVSQCLKPWGAEGWAYVYKREDDRLCLSADHYGSRVLAFAGEAKDGKEVIQRALRGKEEGFLSFIRACRVPRVGGFAWQPGREPDILHTRYGLQVLRFLLYNEVIKADQLPWLRPPSILRYVMACRSFGGFGVRPGILPSLYATREAVNCVKLLEIFRLQGVFTANGEYLMERQRFDEVADRVGDFVDLFQGEEKATFKEFPNLSLLASFGRAA